MKLVIKDRQILVTLSRRNLQTLLNKLDDLDSLKTLIKVEPDGHLVVVAEDDDTHYDRLEGGPGEVHPNHDPNRIKDETIHHTKH